MTIVVAALPAFLASVVEFVEALTIVLAVGVTRQWRSTLVGVGAAMMALTVVVLVFGTGIALLVPMEALRLVVGALLLIFGLQWLCRAILRTAGASTKRDEASAYARRLAELEADPPVPAAGMDWISFTLAFKGVFLEGLEVAFIVVTFGASAGELGPAAVGAAVAGMLVLSVGAVLRQPLARVPENELKFAVGLMLVTFGTFWGGEGTGIVWPAGDATLLALFAGYAAAAVGATWVVRRALRRGPPAMLTSAKA
jgi:uncharacterized membrane protein